MNYNLCPRIEWVNETNNEGYACGETADFHVYIPHPNKTGFSSLYPVCKKHLAELLIHFENENPGTSFEVRVL